MSRLWGVSVLPIVSPEREGLRMIPGQIQTAAGHLTGSAGLNDAYIYIAEVTLLKRKEKRCGWDGTGPQCSLGQGLPAPGG